MERQYDASCLEKHLNKRTNFDGTLIANQLKEYQRYRDTGLTPEEISRLHTLIEQQGRELNRRDELIRKLGEERDYWEREAISDKSKLGLLRLWFGNKGMDMDNALEEISKQVK